MIDYGKREEWEAHIDTEEGMLCIWFGHMRGSCYGNFSLVTKDKKILQKHRGFHCTLDFLHFVLSLPLDWKKIIDCKVYFKKNKASFGVDVRTGEILDKPVHIKTLSLDTE